MNHESIELGIAHTGRDIPPTLPPVAARQQIDVPQHDHKLQLNHDVRLFCARRRWLSLQEERRLGLVIEISIDIACIGDRHDDDACNSNCGQPFP
jgi:hypothetical protein